MRKAKGHGTALVWRDKAGLAIPPSRTDDPDAPERSGELGRIIALDRSRKKAQADIGGRLLSRPPLRVCQRAADAQESLPADAAVTRKLNRDNGSFGLHPAGRGPWSGDYPTAG
jgi:hypothetical protein